MKIYHKNKKIEIPIRKLSYLGMAWGLMFRSRNTENLFFDNFSGAIHSWFVFFPFLALWLDKRNNVLEFKVIEPWGAYFKPEKEFAKLVEIPLNSKNKKILKFFVG